MEPRPTAPRPASPVVLPFVLPIVLLIASLCAGVAIARENDPAPAPEAAPDFNGTWVLNRELSQDLVAMMQPPADRQGGGKRSGGRRGTGGGGRGMRGGGRGAMDGSMKGAGSGDSVQRRQRALRMQQEYSRLEIFREGPELNLTDGLDISQLHFTDGREAVIWTEKGERIARTTAVSGEIRIRTTRRDGGPERMRTFTLAEGGAQLVLTEERVLSGWTDPVRIRMVYDRTD